MFPGQQLSRDRDSTNIFAVLIWVNGDAGPATCEDGRTTTAWVGVKTFPIRSKSDGWQSRRTGIFGIRAGWPMSFGPGAVDDLRLIQPAKEPARRRGLGVAAQASPSQEVRLGCRAILRNISILAYVSVIPAQAGIQSLVHLPHQTMVVTTKILSL